ncbi:hypothetical protein HPP92_022231 [Vanilla planifolia]|uniref:Uncharacterized protein n=1 Tax=Vanilla planifolia TaxID=51239 RepID=A0A835UBQ7_VANPL|nr:hypothetical protein HPP92_022231 [Vanilla planifolia]
MDKQGRNLAPTAPRKKKKKQAKDEADRLKQAEKKKRRLEKAIATSAAIRSELEKKKLKEKEYLERLDVEGAAIAESVALHVLVGEDSDESCNITPSNNRRFSSFDSSHDRSIFMDHYNLAKHSVVLGRISTTYGYRNKWNGSINEMPMSLIYIADISIHLFLKGCVEGRSFSFSRPNCSRCSIISSYSRYFTDSISCTKYSNKLNEQDGGRP